MCRSLAMWREPLRPFIIPRKLTWPDSGSVRDVDDTIYLEKLRMRAKFQVHAVGDVFSYSHFLLRMTPCRGIDSKKIGDAELNDVRAMPRW